MTDEPQQKTNDLHPFSDSRTVKPTRAKSIPLRTALLVARERQRSRSSRRKIFREEPERYLDIVRLMKETGEI